MVQLLNERICSPRSKFVSFRVDPFEKLLSSLESCKNFYPTDVKINGKNKSYIHTLNGNRYVRRQILHGDP